MGAGHERAVVMDAEIAATLVVAEAEFALQLAVVEFDGPAQAGPPSQPLGRAVGGEVGEPVVDGACSCSGHSTTSHSLRGGR